MNYQEIAKTNNLKKLREERGISQQMLGTACFRSASKISLYESGKKMPRYDVLRAISNFLCVPIEEIYPQFKEIDQVAERIRAILIQKHNLVWPFDQLDYD